MKPRSISRAFLGSSSTKSVRVAALAALSLLVACGGFDRPPGELVRDGEVVLDAETLEPYTGAAYASFEDGSDAVAQRRITLLTADYRGPFQGRFKKRTLTSKESYVDGVKHGPYEWFYESGELFERGTYEHGVLEGPYRAYWEEGDVYEEGTYRGGAFDGPRRWFHHDRLIEVVTYRDGTLDGLYERYLDDGSLELKGMLTSGDPCGMWIEGERSISYPPCGPRVTQ